MCGRYALALSNEEVYDSLENQLPRIFQRGAERARWERQQDHRGSYNIAPRTRAPVVRRDPEHGDRAIIETMQWGLVPHWTKHPPSGPLNTINARSEALLDPSSGGMWHALKGNKRCIVPAQGYFEWLKKPSSKVAHFTRLPLGEKNDNLHPPLLFFAGLWDTVRYLSPVESRFQPSDDPEDKREPYPTGNPIPLSTFTILTTAPAKDIAWLHDRMPCILSTEEEVEKWLDLGEVTGWEEGKGGTAQLLRGTTGLDCFPVPPEVGKIGNNSPTFIQPVSERSDGIKSFFQKQAPSPAKPKIKAEPKSTPTKTEQGRPEKEVKQEAEGIKSEITAKDEERGLGDDSNAPNPEVKDEKPEVGEKRKRAKDESDVVEEEKDDSLDKSETTKKAGRQTKVVRRNVEDDTKAQPSITNFFKSPQKSSGKRK